MRHRLAIYAAMLVLFAGMCILENGAERARPAEPSAGRVSSIYALAGEFRIVFANLLWVKAEHYHHEYILRDKNWARDKELMGLLDIITTLDPHFIEAYAVGTYIQKDTTQDKRHAMNYLLRAISLNPKAWELHHLAAILYVRWLNDPERALPHALKSLKYCDGDDFYRRRGARMVRTIRGLIAERQSRLRADPTHQH